MKRLASMLRIKSSCAILSDIDECSDGSNNCHEYAECSNKQGGFICECKTGFGGNGTYCEGKLFSFMLCVDDCRWFSF